jgi:hypothetical protein
MPLENFYTSAVALDLSHVELKAAITVTEMEDALTKSSQEIRAGDTVIGKGQFRLIGFPLKSRLYVAPNCVLDSSLTSPLSLNTAVFSSTRVRLKEEVFQHA